MRAKLKEQLSHLKMRGRDPQAKQVVQLYRTTCRYTYFKTEPEEHTNTGISVRMETTPLAVEHRQRGFTQG